VKSTLRIIFPQFEKELPHWVQGSDGYWYYHTFYQYQPDLDWYNPDVFLEFIKILKFWTEKGMNFRLDAITFMAKNIFTSEVESNPNLHLILQSLNLVLNSINPEAVFMAETCQPMDVIKKYFGTNEVSESKLVYNFKMMQSIWYAYLTADSKFITETLGDIDHKLPSHASWVNFLRNHDELTLEFAPDVVRTKIYETLFSRGKSFIDGFGISGRTFNFVDLNKIDLIFIYKVLASMPGIVAIIYGDEVAKTNDPSNILKILNYKKSVLGLTCEEDTRDLNRGILKDEEIEKGFDVYSKFSEIFNQRLELLKFFTANPKLTQNGSDYILTYTNQNSKLQIRINFLEKICEWQVF
jgi:maltose alpha-D-glucosyltransferase/alpha-amylase